MNKRLGTNTRMEKYIWLMLVFTLGIWLTLPLFHPGLPVSDDGKDHVARIANFYLSITEGNIIPRWAENLNWGYGHPILEFLYPLPSYIASFFHFLGYSFVDATKIVLGLGLVISGVTMYFWLIEFLTKPSALFGAVLYMYVPYRLIDVYTRGDIGENLAFIFMPLILLFMYRLSKIQKYYYFIGISISMAGLILSHNAISLMYVPFILFYGLYLSFISKKRITLFLQYGMGIILGFGLAAFFWIPGLFEGKYTLRNIVTAGMYKTRFIPLQDTIYDAIYLNSKPIFALEVGLLHLLFLVTSFYFMLTRRTDKVLTTVLLLYTLSAVFLMIPQSDFLWQKIPLLQNFQFPWRFLAVTTFTVSVLGGIVFEKISQKVQYILLGVITIFLIVFSISFWPFRGYFLKSDSFFSGIYDGTTDTGESAPIWSVRFMEHRFSTPIEVIAGKASVKQITRLSTRHRYTVVAANNAQLLENTIFFPGWEVFIDGKKTNVEFQDIHHRGLMTFYVSSGTHTVEARYSETRLRKTANFITIISISSILLFGFFTRLFKKIEGKRHAYPLSP